MNCRKGEELAIFFLFYYNNKANFQNPGTALKNHFSSAYDKFIPKPYFFLLLFLFLFPMGSWLKLFCRIDEVPLPENSDCVTLSLGNIEDESAVCRPVSFVLVKEGGNPKNYDDVISRGHFSSDSTNENTVSAYLYTGLNFQQNATENLFVENMVNAEIYLALDQNKGTTNLIRDPRDTRKAALMLNDEEIQESLLPVNRLRAQDVILSPGAEINLSYQQLSDTRVHSKATLTFTGFEDYIGDVVRVRFLKPGGNITNEWQIVSKEYAYVDSNGVAVVEAEFTRGAYSDWSPAVRLGDMCISDLYVYIDENADWWQYPYPDGDDLLLEASPSFVYGDLKMNFTPEDLNTHQRGYSWEQFYELTNIAYQNNQWSTNGLSREVWYAMNLATFDTTYSGVYQINNFFSQDPTLAASKLCTVVHRYVYLKAIEMLYPNQVTNLPSRFGLFYLSSVNKGYVIEKKDSYCFTYNGTDMVNDYITGKQNLYWKYYRTAALTCDPSGEEDYVFTNNAQAIDILYERGAQVALIREGDDEIYGDHTFLAVLTMDGQYRVVDAGYTRLMGLTLEERFQSNDCYIISVTGYLNADL